MILSNKNKFIFLSIPKTASTTAQHLIKSSGILGPSDVLSGYVDIPASGETVRYYPENFPEITYDDYVNNIAERPMHSTGRIYESLKFQFGIEHANKQVLYLALENLTITEIIRLGLVNTISLPLFKVYGIIRDPIQRFLSAYFHFAKLNNAEMSISNVIEYINLISPEFGPHLLMNKPYRSFFEYNGDLIATPILEDQFQATVTNIITSCGGLAPQEFPNLKNQYRPDWSKAPVESWLPPSSLAKLNSILADDIDFYNQFKG